MNYFCLARSTSGSETKEQWRAGVAMHGAHAKYRLDMPAGVLSLVGLTVHRALPVPPTVQQESSCPPTHVGNLSHTTAPPVACGPTCAPGSCRS